MRAMRVALLAIAGAAAAAAATVAIASAVAGSSNAASAAGSGGSAPRAASSTSPNAASEAGPSRTLGAAFLASGAAGGALCESVRAGLERAVRERGGRITEDAPAPSPAVAGIDLHFLSSKLDGRDDEQILRALAEEGRDAVIATGGRFASVLPRVARDFPRVRFVLIGAPRDFRDASANAAYLAFDDAQGAFLAGALAAYMLSGAPKAKLGFVGGTDEPGGRAYQAGFQAGAAYAAPAFRRGGAFLAQFCGRQSGAAFDQATAEAIAASQYKKGAAIVFHAAGAAGQGVYAAARKAGALAMGSGGDLPGGEVVAATVEKGEIAVALIVDELFASGSVKSGARLLGVKEGAVDCALGQGAKEGPAAYPARLGALRELIASGSLRVPYDDASEADFLGSLR
jgi:basic membrane protein A and related proteins